MYMFHFEIGFKKKNSILKVPQFKCASISLVTKSILVIEFCASSNISLKVKLFQVYSDGAIIKMQNCHTNYYLLLDGLNNRKIDRNN